MMIIVIYDDNFDGRATMMTARDDEVGKNR